MIQNGMDFIIIKVAAFGLNKEYLGKRVKDCYEQFAKMVSIYEKKLLVIRIWISSMWRRWRI